MSNHEAFIKRIVEHPEEEQAYHVYADWLEERHDPRARYLRYCFQIRTSDRITVEHLIRYRDFHELRHEISPKWLDQTNLWLIESMPLAHSSGRATDEQIGLFEETHRVELPGDYQRFLKKHNGGAPFECRQIVDGNEVAWFRGLEYYCYRGYDENCEDLATACDDFAADWQDDNPIWSQKPLPIASTSNGELCLVGRGANRGNIVVFDREANSFSPHTNSFSEFITGLRLCSFKRDEPEPTPLLQAIQAGDRKSFLEEFNAEQLDQANSLRGDPPIILAILFWRIDMIHFLLDAGANVNVQRKSGKCALDLAAILNPDFVKLLLNHGADPNGIDNEQPSPLYWAAINGHERSCILLAEHGARIETRGGYYKTVAEALEYGEIDFAEEELRDIAKESNER